jgi:hypothetical protein
MPSGIWHCVVWWTVISSAEEPDISIFRMKAAEHHVPENSPCHENLKPHIISLHFTHHFSVVMNQYIQEKHKLPSSFTKTLMLLHSLITQSKKIPRTERYITQDTKLHKVKNAVSSVLSETTELLNHSSVHVNMLEEEVNGIQSHASLSTESTSTSTSHASHYYCMCEV